MCRGGMKIFSELQARRYSVRNAGRGSSFPDLWFREREGSLRLPRRSVLIPKREAGGTDHLVYANLKTTHGMIRRAFSGSVSSEVQIGRTGFPIPPDCRAIDPSAASMDVRFDGYGERRQDGSPESYVRLRSQAGIQGAFRDRGGKAEGIHHPTHPVSERKHLGVCPYRAERRSFASKRFSLWRTAFGDVPWKPRGSPPVPPFNLNATSISSSASVSIPLFTER